MEIRRLMEQEQVPDYYHPSIVKKAENELIDRIGRQISKFLVDRSDKTWTVKITGDEIRHNSYIIVTKICTFTSVEGV